MLIGLALQYLPSLGCHSQKTQTVSLTWISLHTIQVIRSTEPGDSAFFWQPWISLTSFLGQKNATAALSPDSYYFALQAGRCDSFSLQEVTSPCKLQVRPFSWIFLLFGCGFFCKLLLLLFNSLQCVKLISKGEGKIPGGLAADSALTISLYEEQDSPVIPLV